MNAGRLLILLTALFGVALSGCGGGGGESVGDGTIPIRAPTTEVLEGDTLALTADTKVSPLAWMSSDTRIASVNAQGAVVGRTEGPVTITVMGPGPERGSIDLHVVADKAFNLSLPREGKDFAPTLQRQISAPTCDVTLNLSGLGATVRRENYRPYHRLQLPHSGVLREIGKPELPFFTLYFAIPVDAQTHEPASWDVTVVRESPRTYEGIRPWPHQPPRWTADTPELLPEIPPFAVDEALYESVKAWPETTYAARAIHVGNLPILEVKVIPAQYTPTTMTLDLFQITRVSVDFESGSELRMPRPLGDYKGIKEVSADAFITEVAQNSELLNPVNSMDFLNDLPPLDPTTFQDEYFDLLILTRPSLGLAALRLAEWRQAEGVRVWLEVCDATTYPDAGSLLALIHDLDERNRFDLLGGFRPHVMRAICLFGDVEHIPTWEGLTARNANPPASADDYLVPIVGTDYPYSTLRGDDQVADISLGRISVDSRSQGDDVVDKIVAYESKPADDRPHHASVWGLFDDRPHERAVLPGSVRFYNGEAFVRGLGTFWHGQIQEGDVIRPAEGVDAHKGGWRARVARVVDNENIELEHPWTKAEDTDSDILTHGAGLQVGVQDGQDDWELVKGTERIRHFLRGRGVEVEYGYVREERPPTAPMPTHGFDGNPLHGDLLSYLWDANAAQVTSWWRQGLDGIVLYCGHGKPEGWYNPNFVEGNLLQNDSAGGWYPIVVSMSCNSGFFDSETDRVWEWDDDAGEDGEAVIVETTGTEGYGTHDVSFCEQVLREPDGGGIAAIGGSRGLDGGKNDRLIDGLFSAFYGDYAEGAAALGFGAAHAYGRLGDAVRVGKLAMHSWMLAPRPLGGGYTNPDVALYPLQAIHLFGDPMLKMRLPEGPSDAR